MNGAAAICGGFIERVSNFLGRLFARPGAGKLYYINGAGTLPPPLSSEEEAQTIARLESEDAACADAARRLLIEHNLRLVVYIAKKFENTGTGIEDLISIGTIGLIKAINTFRADKNIKLATYASRCIENEILMYIRKSAGKHDLSIDEPLSVDWDGNELLLSDILGSDEEDVSHGLEVIEEKKTIRDALSHLSEREQLIITLRYGLNGGRELTQKEVADMLGISQSYISRLEKKILSRLGSELATRL
ncbi:MAG: RNA polymerase sporulation sigma factor SigK [Clostridia bacterium]|nr:RNA polymerase sporulation sigma factor SigK [Clostridia bacterium]